MGIRQQEESAESVAEGRGHAAGWETGTKGGIPRPGEHDPPCGGMYISLVALPLVYWSCVVAEVVSVRLL